MSAWMYGEFTRRALERKQASTETDGSGAPGETLPKAQRTTVDNGKKSTVTKVMETLTALIPAEGLAVITGTRYFFSETKSAGDTEMTTTIVNNVARARIAVALAIIVSLISYGGALYRSGKWSVIKKRFRRSDILRFMIPVAAFVLWLMLGYTPIYNAVRGQTITDNTAGFWAFVGSIALVGLVNKLKYKVKTA